MKNKLSDLNNYLFEQLERLNDEDIDTERLQFEIERTKAVTVISNQIISNAKLVLDAQKSISDLTESQKLPLMLQ